MKIKTSELEGIALDWAVAIALNGQKAFFDAFGARSLGRLISGEVKSGRISPSTDWSQCGPFIEAYEVELMPWSGGWVANCLPSGHGEGGTHLIAACRAIVAANLGDEIDVPDELTEPRS